MLIQRILPAAAALVAALSLQGTNAATIGADEKHSAALIAWLRSNKGYFNPKLEMRRVDPDDPNSHFGMFANQKIQADHLMLRVPSSLILGSGDDDEEITAMMCGLVRNLHKQLVLKDESEYAPYVKYLLETQPPGQLPSAWSDEGKDLLMKVLGDDKYTTKIGYENLRENGDLGLNNKLPPADPIGWIEHEWYKDCGGSNDPLEEYAALLVVQRCWDDILIPVFDMMSHRNGLWLNTYSNNVHQGEDVKVRAKRDIEEGEEIYTTYNFCEDCGARKLSYGTPEILRDYGFVEQMPQSWIFPDIDLGFRIDELEDNDEDGAPKYALMEWIEREPDEDDVAMLKVHVGHVMDTKATTLSSRKDYADVPQREWDIIVQFIDAMELAINTALDSFYQAEGRDSCIEEGTCTASLSRYADLETPYQTVQEEYYSKMTCDIDTQFEVFDDGTFVEIDSFKSQYQQINFLYNSENRDTCMDLDDTIQICDSYRPHYHEMGVHYTARFLPENSVKRVLFVGGGDSMLLHEVLKYPTLELVVGLEIDQKVTRGCFKHFGTQPHFDDDRVEWWFGDASKSLLMLPKDYFGSFDLVLVDLSETVMSFKVTEKLDVLEALTLLLKPDGIFVKNEVYFSTFQTMFPYSAQVNW